MSAIKSSVRDGFIKFTEQFEGHTRYFYLDVKGLVTIGYGNLADPIPLVAGLVFMRPDGTVAAPSEVSAAWLTVKNRQDMSQRGGGAFASLTSIRATDESIHALVFDKLEHFGEVLAEFFHDFASWPASAQLGLLSMAWALGPAFPPHWPRFSAACRARDWSTAADGCHMKESDNPGVAPRNVANTALFRAAVGEEPCDVTAHATLDDDGSPPIV